MTNLKRWMIAAGLATGVTAGAALAEEGQPDVRITYDEDFKLGQAEHRYSAETQGRFNFITILCDVSENDGDYGANLEFYPPESYILNDDSYFSSQYRETRDYRVISDSWRHLALGMAETFGDRMNQMAEPKKWTPIPKGEAKPRFDGVVSASGQFRIFNNQPDVINFWANEDFDASGQIIDQEVLEKVTSTVRAQCGFGL